MIFRAEHKKWREYVVLYIDNKLCYSRKQSSKDNMLNHEIDLNNDMYQDFDI